MYNTLKFSVPFFAFFAGIARIFSGMTFFDAFIIIIDDKAFFATNTSITTFGIFAFLLFFSSKSTKLNRFRPKSLIFGKKLSICELILSRARVIFCTFVNIFTVSPSPRNKTGFTRTFEAADRISTIRIFKACPVGFVALKSSS